MINANVLYIYACARVTTHITSRSQTVRQSRSCVHKHQDSETTAGRISVQPQLQPMHQTLLTQSEADRVAIDAQRGVSNQFYRSVAILTNSRQTADIKSKRNCDCTDDFCQTASRALTLTLRRFNRSPSKPPHKSHHFVDVQYHEVLMRFEISDDVLSLSAVSHSHLFGKFKSSAK
jgi:hypothetical protein